MLGNLSMFSFLTRFLILYIRLLGNLCAFFIYIYYNVIYSPLAFFHLIDYHICHSLQSQLPISRWKSNGKITFTSVWIYTSIIQYEYIIAFRYTSFHFKTTIASNHKNNTDTCFIPWEVVSSKHIMTSNKSVIFMYILCSYDNLLV